MRRLSTYTTSVRWELFRYGDVIVEVCCHHFVEWIPELPRWRLRYTVWELRPVRPPMGRLFSYRVRELGKAVDLFLKEYKDAVSA